MACEQIIQGRQNIQQSHPQQNYDILIIYDVLPNNSKYVSLLFSNFCYT